MGPQRHTRYTAGRQLFLFEPLVLTTLLTQSKPNIPIIYVRYPSLCFQRSSPFLRRTFDLFSRFLAMRCTPLSDSSSSCLPAPTPPVTASTALVPCPGRACGGSVSRTIYHVCRELPLLRSCVPPYRVVAFPRDEMCCAFRFFRLPTSPCPATASGEAPSDNK